MPGSLRVCGLAELFNVSKTWLLAAFKWKSIERYPSPVIQSRSIIVQLVAVLHPSPFLHTGFPVTQGHPCSGGMLLFGLLPLYCVFPVFAFSMHF